MSESSPILQQQQPKPSPTRSTKRRRLDNASHTLSKPFKSPFKTPTKPSTDTRGNTSAIIPSSTENDSKSKVPLNGFSPTQPTPSTTSSSKQQDRSFDRSSYALLSLQKKHTHLVNQLSAARSNLEISNQALKIESSNRDADLEALAFKWRAASRAAAEEVFTGARDKVHSMGGVGALRERERQCKEKAWGWSNDLKKSDVNDEGDEVDNEDGPSFRKGEEEGEDQDEREEGARKSDPFRGDDDGYTMDMMLKTLNVDLDIIGFDKELQKWID